MALRVIRGIRVEELDLSKPLLNRSRRSLPRKDYLAMQNAKVIKSEEKPIEVKKEELSVETNNRRKSRRLKRPSMWLADCEIGDLLSDSETSPTVKKKKRTDSDEEFECRAFSCSYCSLSFLSPIELNRHTVVHTGSGPLQCELCHQRFSLQILLDRHRSRVHPPVRGKSKILQRKPDEKPFSCKTCKKRFKKQKNLKTHVQDFHSKQEFKCELCNRSFEGKHSLLIHWQGKVCHYIDFDD